MTAEPFTWRDGERTVAFGRGRLADAVDLIGGVSGDEYTLLTTSRCAALAPEVVSAAGTVHEVAPGRVDEVAGELRTAVDGELLVALGGGRVVDVAKALAAAAGPAAGVRVASPAAAAR